MFKTMPTGERNSRNIKSLIFKATPSSTFERFPDSPCCFAFHGFLGKLGKDEGVSWQENGFKVNCLRE